MAVPSAASVLVRLRCVILKATWTVYVHLARRREAQLHRVRELAVGVLDGRVVQHDQGLDRAFDVLELQQSRRAPLACNHDRQRSEFCRADSPPDSIWRGALTFKWEYFNGGRWGNFLIYKQSEQRVFRYVRRSVEKVQDLKAEKKRRQVRSVRPDTGHCTGSERRKNCRWKGNRAT